MSDRMTLFIPWPPTRTAVYRTVALPHLHPTCLHIANGSVPEQGRVHLLSRVVLMGDIDRQLIPSWDRQILDRQRGASVKPSELVIVSSFRSVADAQIAKGLLDQAG